jgi:hypothetical protein
MGSQLVGTVALASGSTRSRPFSGLSAITCVMSTQATASDSQKKELDKK